MICVKDVMMPGKNIKINNRFFLFSFFIILIFFDQISKLVVINYFDLFESIELLPFLNLTFVINYGFAFGFLNNPSLNQIFVSCFIAAIIIYFFYLLLKTQDKSFQMNLLLILAGAVGNFIDRIYRGFVIDFIDIYVTNYHWPAFNFADSYISIGFIIMLFNILFLKKKI